MPPPLRQTAPPKSPPKPTAQPVPATTPTWLFQQPAIRTSNWRKPHQTASRPAAFSSDLAPQTPALGQARFVPRFAGPRPPPPGQSPTPPPGHTPAWPPRWPKSPTPCPHRADSSRRRPECIPQLPETKQRRRVVSRPKAHPRIQYHHRLAKFRLDLLPLRFHQQPVAHLDRAEMFLPRLRPILPLHPLDRPLPLAHIQPGSAKNIQPLAKRRLLGRVNRFALEINRDLGLARAVLRPNRRRRPEDRFQQRTHRLPRLWRR